MADKLIAASNPTSRASDPNPQSNVNVGSTDVQELGSQEADAKGAARWLARLWVQAKKAAIPAIVTAVLGYAGGFVVPPATVYDWIFRQNPNDFGGTWLGSAAGSQAKLRLTEMGGRKLTGTLEFKGRTIKVEGNHDSQLVLEGELDPSHDLKIGLMRKLGERFGADNDFLLLVANENQKQPPILVCEKDAMDITAEENCHPLGHGVTFFAKKRDDPK